MSEASAGAAAAPSAGGAQEAGLTQGTGAGNAQDQGAGKAQGKAGKAEAGSPEDDFEEIAVGSVKGKVPKSIAKVVKDLERGFHAKSQENAGLRKELKGMEDTFKSNPKAMFQKFGVSADEFAEMTLAEKLEMLSMSPEQKELRELKAFKEQQEKAEKDRQEADKKAKEEQEQSQLMQRLDTEIADAWKESGLPKDLFFVKQMAAIMLDGERLLEEGRLQEALTAKQAAAIVKQRFDASVRSILGQLEPESLHNFLGADKFKQLREWDLKRVTQKAATSANANPNRLDSSTSGNPQIDSKKTMNEREYRAYMAKLTRG